MTASGRVTWRSICCQPSRASRKSLPPVRLSRCPPVRLSACPPVRLPRRPGHLAPAQHMKMQMIHALPRIFPVLVTIRYPPGSSPSSSPPRPRTSAAAPAASPFCSLRVPDRRDVLRRNHQHMGRRPGVDVPEGDHILRSLHDRRRDLARHDPAEQTISHRSPVVGRQRQRPRRRSPPSRTAVCGGPGSPAAKPAARSRSISSAVSPPSGPITMVSGVCRHHRRDRCSARIRHPAWPARAAVPQAVERDRLLHPRRPGGAALLHRLQRVPPQPLEVLGPQPAGDARRPLGLQRDHRRDAELGRLLHQPGEPVPIPGSHRKRQLRRPCAPVRPRSPPRPRSSPTLTSRPSPTSPSPSRTSTDSPSSARRTRR